MWRRLLLSSFWLWNVDWGHSCVSGNLNLLGCHVPHKNTTAPLLCAMLWGRQNPGQHGWHPREVSSVGVNGTLIKNHQDPAVLFRVFFFSQELHLLNRGFYFRPLAQNDICASLYSNQQTRIKQNLISLGMLVPHVVYFVIFSKWRQTNFFQSLYIVFWYKTHLKEVLNGKICIPLTTSFHFLFHVVLTPVIFCCMTSWV